MAWTRKYFIEDSFSYGVLSFCIKGMNDKRFISSPIQAPTHVDEEIDINVPVIKDIINNKEDIFHKIKKRKILYFHEKGMNLLA